MHPMRSCASHLARRCFALALAYLLALQVILTAWAALAPSVAAQARAATCATQMDGALPKSGQPTHCGCGPMCPMISGAGGMPSSATISLVSFRVALTVPMRPLADTVQVRRVASEPEQARAPPVLT
jgi:hypothetical protein